MFFAMLYHCFYPRLQDSPHNVFARQLFHGPFLVSHLVNLRSHTGWLLFGYLIPAWLTATVFPTDDTLFSSL